MNASEPTPPPIPVHRKNWWGRNWKWVVPSGCLGIILALVGFSVCIALAVFGILKSTDVYQQAVKRAQSDVRVQNALGTPIETGLLVSGNTEGTGASRSAKLAIPIFGPKGKATLYVEATKSAGLWNYSQLVVEIANTKERISLQPQASPPSATP